MINKITSRKGPDEQQFTFPFRGWVKGFYLCITMLFLLSASPAHADDKIYPDKPNPPVLVNDFAHLMSADEVAQLERKLEDYATATSTQITIVTIKNLGGHDVEEYSVEVFSRWGIGQGGKNNGVLLLASLDDRKAWISVGKGLEGVLTDNKSGLIFRNELVPAFKQQQYYTGLSNSADAIIAVTKGEYSADGLQKKQHIPLSAIIIGIVFIIFIIRLMGRGGGGSGGGGIGNFATGMLLGNMLGGGFGGGRGDDGGFGGGGFGGFGGGSSGGGGAGGSW